MTAVERLTAEQLADADPWDVTPKPVPAGSCPGCGQAGDDPAQDGHGAVCGDPFHASTEPTPEPYDEQTAAAAAIRCADDVDQLGALAHQLDVDLLGGLDYWRQHQDLIAHASLVDSLQAVRKRLAQLEAQVARAGGQLVRGGLVEREGFLPDGRRFELTKGKDRKAWSHDQWQADVRREVLSGVGTLVDQTTGEVVDAHALLAGVEQAHGSTAPRVGVLKKLGLTPDDYCETVPGPWAVRVYGDTPGDDDA